MADGCTIRAGDVLRVDGWDRLTHRSRWQPLIEVLAQGPRRAPDIQGAATLVGIGKCQFRKVFRAQTGIAWGGFRVAWRMQEARRIVAAEPNTCLYGVALRVGYKSEAGFFRAYHRYWGATPRRRLESCVSGVDTTCAPPSGPPLAS